MLIGGEVTDGGAVVVDRGDDGLASGVGAEVWSPVGRQTGAMSEPKPVRPPQATVAGWLVVGGSVVVVLMALGQGARCTRSTPATRSRTTSPARPVTSSASACRAC